uniref:Uncharacterized protein n=1 Tax=Pararge aegeria TaxID=116150 RepID=S4NMV4_9NEOP
MDDVNKDEKEAKAALETAGKPGDQTADDDMEDWEQSVDELLADVKEEPEAKPEPEPEPVKKGEEVKKTPQPKSSPRGRGRGRGRRPY